MPVEEALVSLLSLAFDQEILVAPRSMQQLLKWNYESCSQSCFVISYSYFSLLYHLTSINVATDCSYQLIAVAI
jgi:hypothetical protein